MTRSNAHNVRTGRTPVVSGSEPITPDAVHTPRPDTVWFIRPNKAAERQQTHAEAVGNLRDLLTEGNRIAGRVLAFLVQVLIVGTNVDGKDALDALRDGDGKVEGITAKQLSHARAAHYLVSTAGVKSSEDPRWDVALRAAQTIGVGKERMVKAIDSKRATKNARQALAESILGAAAEVNGSERDAKIREAFPSQTSTPVGTAAWRNFDKAISTARTVAGLTPENKGMSPEEREQAHLMVTRLADLLSAPAPVKVDES